MKTKSAFVIIVQDDPEAASQIKTAMKEAGILSTSVYTPQAALEVLPRREVDLLLATVRPEDIRLDLPGQVRRRSPRTKVILLLRAPASWQVEEAIAQQAFDVLTSPLEISQMVEAVQGALDSPSPRLPARAARALCDSGQVRQAALESVRALVKAVEAKDPEPAGGSTWKQTLKLVEGIPQDKAKRLVALLKESKIKVQASIQGDQLRVSGKSKDDLQEAMAKISAADIGLDVTFTNFK